MKLETLPVSTVNSDWEMLPREFVALVTRSLTLQNRITSIDEEVYAQSKSRPPEENPVRQQLDLLSTALGMKLN